MNRIKDIFKNPFVSYGVIAVALVVVIAVIYFVFSALFATKSYESLEESLVSAAQRYYAANTDGLPVKVGDSVTIESIELVSSGYLKEMVDSADKEIICKGSVKVTKLGNESYSYRPILACGSNYNTKTLAEELTKEENIVASGEGLYEMYGEYIFRGEKVNNYLQIEDDIWYIVKVAESGEVKAILSTTKTENTNFDDRYNSEKNWASGYNNYEKSRIKETLSNHYNNNYEYLENYASPHTICIGGRNSNDKDNTGLVECKKTLDNELMGLLQVNEYLYASLDENCSTVDQEQCSNYNYFDRIDMPFWSITPNSENSYEVYQIYDGVNVTLASSYSKVLPVIYLDKDVIYAGGDGSETNPYVIR